MLAGKLMSRLEFRRDMSDQNTFPYRDGSFGNSTIRIQSRSVWSTRSAAQTQSNPGRLTMAAVIGEVYSRPSFTEFQFLGVQGHDSTLLACYNPTPPVVRLKDLFSMETIGSS